MYQRNPDDALRVKFFIKAVPNKAKSVEAGGPVYDSIEYVEIDNPHSKNTIQRVATAEDRARFRGQYEAFKSDKPEDISGHLIDDWPAPDALQRQMLRDAKVWTVEQLAAMSDEVVKGVVQQGVILRDKARLWLDLGAQQGKAVELAYEQGKEIATLRQRVAELEANEAKLAGQLHVAMAGTPAKLDDPDGILEGMDMSTVRPAGPRVDGRRRADA